MANECKYYDAELDCCRQLSDWTEPMPILQPCVESPCEYYTKANEWISVKDRLPEAETRVLVAIDSKHSYTKIDTDKMMYRQWVRWGLSVTHWMPLPEPPKKEGATDGE